MERVLISLLPLTSLDLTHLMQRAAQVRLPGAPIRKGASSEAMKAHHGGRVAAQMLFERLAIDAKVGVNRVFGYVMPVDQKGRRIKSLFLNISHTNGYAAAAIASFPIGVDLEMKTRSADRVLTRVASSGEVQEAFSTLPQSYSKNILPAGIALWSAKEASAKAVGLGMKFGLQRFRISFQQGPPYSVDIRVKGPMNLKQPFLNFFEHGELLISVCTESFAWKNPPEIILP